MARTDLDRRPERPPDALERRRPAVAAGPEQHRLVAAVARDDGPPLVVATQLGVVGPSGPAWFQAAVLDGDRPLVVSETEVPVPVHGWEIRASGLWAAQVCETPWEHWSYGLEAFALAVDEPAELLGRALGERVPLGWELEFEASDEPELDLASNRYRQLGTVHGLLLSAAGERAIEGRGVRSHRWAGAPFADDVVLADGTAAPPPGGTAASRHSGAGGSASAGSDRAVALPGLGEVWWITRTAAGARTTTDYHER